MHYENSLSQYPLPVIRVLVNRYLVDPASSHMLVSKIKPCMSKHKPNMVKPRIAHYNSLSLLDLKSYMDNCGNSRANTRNQTLTLRAGCIY